MGLFWLVKVVVSLFWMGVCSGGWWWVYFGWWWVVMGGGWYFLGGGG